VAVFLRLLVNWIALLPAAALAYSPHSYECTHSEESCAVGVRWNQRTIPFVVLRNPRVSEAQHALLLDAVKHAAGQWSGRDCSDLRLEFQGVVDEVDPAGKVNYVTIIDRNWTCHPTDGCGRVAVTKVMYNTRNGNILRSLIILNEDYFDLVDSDESAACPPEPDAFDNGERDIYAVLTHEFGHFVGFAHPCEWTKNQGYAEPEVEGVDEDLESDESKVLTEPPRMTQSSTASDGVVCPVTSCHEVEKDLRDTSTLWPTIDMCENGGRTLAALDVDALCFVYPAGDDSRSCRPADSVSIESGSLSCSAHGPAKASSWLAFLLLGAIATLTRKVKHVSLCRRERNL